jgi:hypothetical protein
MAAIGRRNYGRGNLLQARPLPTVLEDVRDLLEQAPFEHVGRTGG